MSDTARGVVIIVVVGLALLIVAALADRRTRLRLENERPPGAPDSSQPPPAYITDDQLAKVVRVDSTVGNDTRWAGLIQSGMHLDLGLADAGFATMRGGYAAIEGAAVLVCGDAIETMRELLGVLGRTGMTGLIIVAPAFQPEVSATLVANARAGTLRLLALTGGGDALAAMAAATGATVVPRIDLQADDVSPGAFGQVERALADARRTWLEIMEG